ncbi:MAG: hypothetical protein KAJ19_12800 [Gammaproteobacteria bacterium]|nr:hypothetical protein [Gammaproteobacteria bacterium]
MDYGEFTKEEVDRTKTAVEEVFRALPDEKKTDYVVQLSNIFFFLAIAREAAPE